MNDSGEINVEKIAAPKVVPTENSKPKEEVVVENGKSDNKVQQDSESSVTSAKDTEGKTSENHVNAGSDNENAEKEDKTEEKKPSKLQYSLSAVVCYIDDKSNEDRRNIVALLRVGPNYHERSSGSAVFNWYIFNDFWYVD